MPLKTILKNIGGTIKTVTEFVEDEVIDPISNEVEYRAKELEQFRDNTFGTAEPGSWEMQTSNLVQKDGFVGSSVNAYKSVYPYVAAAIENGQVEVTYIDYDGDVNTNDNKDINTNDILEKLNDISGKVIAIDGKLSGRRFF